MNENVDKLFGGQSYNKTFVNFGGGGGNWYHILVHYLPRTKNFELYHTYSNYFVHIKVLNHTGIKHVKKNQYTLEDDKVLVIILIDIFATPNKQKDKFRGLIYAHVSVPDCCIELLRLRT